jgi:hypothetical protein
VTPRLQSNCVHLAPGELKSLFPEPEEVKCVRDT